MPLSEEFAAELRRVLNHFYDAPERLGKSPLVAWLGLAGHPNAGVALQKLILGAIHAAHPQPDEAADSPQRRIYTVLVRRYEQQFSQHEVAGQIGLSVRQYRRIQDAAVQQLASRLWRQHHLDDLAAPVLAAPALRPRREGEDGGDPSGGDQSGGLSEELSWIDAVAGSAESDSRAAIMQAIHLAQPLAERHGLRISAQLEPDLPCAAIHPVVLGQLLLNLLNAAILNSAGAVLTAAAQRQDRQLALTITCAAHSPPAGLSFPDRALTLALVNRCQGSVAITAADGNCCIRLLLPAADKLPILAVDDNADTLTLFERYLIGTRYRLLAVQQPDRLLDEVASRRPIAVVLDVMMPQINGWDLLAQLRSHPAGRQLPIIVCTVLDQHELALALGASGFLKKPVTRRAFFAALGLDLPD